MAARARKSKSDYGSIYKGHEGQWSWMLHRITGVAVILFLFVHVVDTALIGWGPDAYEKVLKAYANPLVHLLETGLMVAVWYHSINGLRVTILDFFPSLVSRARPIGLLFTLIFVGGTIPVLWIMLGQTIDLWRA